MRGLSTAFACLILAMALACGGASSGALVYAPPARCVGPDGRAVVISDKRSCAAEGLREESGASVAATGASGPSVAGSVGGPVYVHGYTRANGTYVAPYTRRR